MSEWPMQGHFRYLRFKNFPMTPRTPQCEVFCPLLSSSEHSGVPEDSKSPTFPSVGLHPHTWPKWGCDTTHPITQIGKVPLSMQDGQTKYLEKVLHVPTITKKFVSVGQMVEQGLQVTFNPNGCFVEDMKNQGKLITKGEKNGRMFTLDVNMSKVNSMLFTHGKGVKDIGIWHK